MFWNRNDLTLRAENDGLTVRVYQSIPRTVDEGARSVETVMATENMVRVFDMKEQRIYDEVLLMKGAKLPDQVPLLDSHDRSSVQKVLGSTRNLRIEGGELVGRDFYSSVREGQDAFVKVREGHVRDHSIGYRVMTAAIIRPGDTQVVAGRSFTARPDMALRIGLEWEPRENSVCAIGSDGAAKTRSENTPTLGSRQEDAVMKFGDWLAKRGLQEDKLTEEQKVLLRADFDREVAAMTTRAPAPASAPTVAVTAGVTAEQFAAEATRAVEAATAAARRMEADRIATIRKEAGNDIPAAVVDRCIAEGMDVPNARSEFLKVIRSRATASPAIHVLDASDLTRQHLEAVMLVRAGSGLEETAVKSYGEPVCERARKMRDMPLIDLCRFALALDGIPAPVSRQDLIRSAFSSTSLPIILGAVANKSLLRGYTDTADTWRAWTRIGSVSDFKSVTRARLTDAGELELVNNAGEVPHGSAVEEYEQFNIATYAKQFAVTRTNIINDDLGVFTRTPERMGRSAKLLIAKLVYTVLLSNPNMKDGVALFHATHGNLVTTAALAATGLAKVLLSFRAITDATGESIDVSPKFLLTGPTLDPTAKSLLLSDLLITTALGSTAAVATAPNANIYKNALTPISENRLENTKYTGNSATTWYAIGDPAQVDTIEVAFLNGQEQPTIERFDADIDTLGVGFRVYLDVGAAPIDFRGMQKATA